MNSVTLNFDVPLSDASKSFLQSLLGSAAPVGGAGGPVPVPTSDANQYPFAMPAVTGNATVALGAGPNTFSIILANNPGQNPPLSFNVIFQRPDGSMLGIAGPLTSTSYDGEGGTGQAFQFKGPWGSNPKFLIAPAAGGSGTNGMFIHSASIDLVPMGIYGQLNSRGGSNDGQDHTFISNNGTATIMLTSNQPPVVQPDPASSFTATPTLIGGKTLLQIVAAGGSVTLPAQTIIGTALVPAGTTLSGAGMGQTVIDGTGLEPKEDKALLVLQGGTVHDLTVQNAWVPLGLGLNASGIRNETGAVDVDLLSVEVTGCQDGVMTQFDTAGRIIIAESHIHHNGDVTQPGVTGTSAATHNLYLGGLPGAVATLTDNVIESCRDAHEVKCRCGTLNATGNTITTGGNGSCYDLPNGGAFDIRNETWTLPASAADRNFMTFGMENGNNNTIGKGGALTNIVFVDLTGQGGALQCHAANVPGSVLNLVGCTYKGPIKPVFVGWGTVNGDITVAP